MREIKSRGKKWAPCPLLLCVICGCLPLATAEYLRTAYEDQQYVCFCFVVSKVQDEDARTQPGAFSVSAGQEAKEQKGQPTPMALLIHPLIRKEFSRREHLPKGPAPNTDVQGTRFPTLEFGELIPDHSREYKIVTAVSCPLFSFTPPIFIKTPPCSLPCIYMHADTQTRTR